MWSARPNRLRDILRLINSVCSILKLLNLYLLRVMKNSRVKIGNPGQTPKKELMYSQSAPAESVSWLAYAQKQQDRSEVSRDSKSGLAPFAADDAEVERPKTSRHKQHPTPDEFTDYVIPSPDRGLPRASDERNVISFDRIINEEVKPGVF